MQGPFARHYALIGSRNIRAARLVCREVEKSGLEWGGRESPGLNLIGNCESTLGAGSAVLTTPLIPVLPLLFPSGLIQRPNRVGFRMGCTGAFQA